MNVLFLTGFALLVIGLVKAIGVLWSGFILVVLAVLLELA